MKQYWAQKVRLKKNALNCRLRGIFIIGIKKFAMEIFAVAELTSVIGFVRKQKKHLENRPTNRLFRRRTFNCGMFMNNLVKQGQNDILAIFQKFRCIKYRKDFTELFPSFIFFIEINSH